MNNLIDAITEQWAKKEEITVNEANQKLKDWITDKLIEQKQSLKSDELTKLFEDVNNGYFKLDHNAILPTSSSLTKKQIKTIGAILYVATQKYKVKLATNSKSQANQEIDRIQAFIDNYQFKARIIDVHKQNKLTVNEYKRLRKEYVDEFLFFTEQYNIKKTLVNGPGYAIFLYSMNFFYVDLKGKMTDSKEPLQMYDVKSGLFKIVDDDDIASLLNLLPDCPPTSTMLNTKYKQLKAITLDDDSRYKPQQLDVIKDDWLFCNNTIVNLNTKETLSYGPLMFANKRLDVVYDKDAEFVKSKDDQTIIDILLTIMDDNEDRLKSLLKVYRQALLGKNLGETIINFVGRGGTGKSTVTDLMKYMIGDSNILFASIDQFSDDNYLNEIDTKFITLGQDYTDGKYIGDTKNLKSLSSNDTILVNAKYQLARAVTFSGVIIQNSPTLLQFNDSQGQMTRRLKIISFKRNFTDNDKQIDKSEMTFLLRSQKNQSAFLNYLIDMNEFINGNKFDIVQEDKDLLQEAKMINDPMLRCMNYAEENYPELFNAYILPKPLLKAIYDDSQGISPYSGKRKHEKSFHNDFKIYIEQKDYDSEQDHKSYFDCFDILELLTGKRLDDLDDLDFESYLPSNSNVLKFVKDLQKSKQLRCYKKK